MQYPAGVMQTSFCLTVRCHFINIQDMVERAKDGGDNDWEYGDAWKTGSPDDPVPEDATEYVAILRGDTGKGLSDTTMLEYVLYLGERGIKATFDAYPLEQIKTYVLKVEAGKEYEAIKLLAEKWSDSR